MTGSVELRSAELVASVAVGRGGDIAALTDLRSGASLLHRPPWADAVSPDGWAPDSRQAWISGYAGGWQLLCPNAGDAGPVAGGTWGFHGEASRLRWTAHEVGADRVTLSVRLTQAPVRIHRDVGLDGAVLHVRDAFRNESPDPIAVAVVQHPVFGPPLVAPGTRVAAGAAILRHDGDFDTPVPWPVADLAVLPEGGPGRSALAYLDDFDGHWAAITAPDGALGVAMAWDGAVLPHAWLWFEGHATAEQPWFRTEYVLAIEPASTVPASGAAAVDPQRLVTLEPGAVVTTSVCLAVHHDRRRVVGVDPQGAITFEEGDDA